MKNTLMIINKLVAEGIINKYAIAGDMAQFYYIEPSVTYVLDLIVHISDEEDSLNPLKKLYEWARKNNFTLDIENIIIEGIPVQFLIAYNDLVREALDNAIEVKLFEQKTYILSAEYLMAIMIQTGRRIDKERFIRFLQEAEYDKVLLNNLFLKYNLEKNYEKIINEI